jgi:hypothetical protein
MRGLIASPIVVVVVAALGIVLCKAIGVDPGYRELVLAGAIALAATVLATVPLILTRGASPFAVSQAALVGTVVHLLTAIGAGAMVYLQLKPGPAFLYWLTGLYWVSLLTVVVCSVQAVRSAPPEASTKVGPAVADKPAAKD